ncbi:Uncharacterized protein conserved in bacteria [Chlamydia trachomatis]|nr:Uncharacterized protein conserved in bacteria [Chlamydia trachomatis]
MNLYKIEGNKYRGKRLFLLIALFIFLEFMIYGVQLFYRQSSALSPQQSILLSLDAASLYHVVLLPIFLASLASISVQIESHHQMWKMLLMTGVGFQTILVTKFRYIFEKVFLMQVINTALFCGLLYGRQLLVAMPWGRFFLVNLGTILISLAILLVHFVLSLSFSNQLMSLSIALIGSLVGIIFIFVPAPFYLVSPYSWYGLLINLHPEKVGQHFVYHLQKPFVYPFIASLIVVGACSIWLLKGKGGKQYV